jgi:hypothetical protein
MPESFKPKLRKRVITGWRHVERRRADIRSKHRSPPVTLAKREA